MTSLVLLARYWGGTGPDQTSLGPLGFDGGGEQSFWGTPDGDLHKEATTLAPSPDGGGPGRHSDGEVSNGERNIVESQM
jgi:hypothetical protein